MSVLLIKPALDSTKRSTASLSFHLEVKSYCFPSCVSSVDTITPPAFSTLSFHDICNLACRNDGSIVGRKRRLIHCLHFGFDQDTIGDNLGESLASHSLVDHLPFTMRSHHRITRIINLVSHCELLLMLIAVVIDRRLTRAHRNHLVHSDDSIGGGGIHLAPHQMSDADANSVSIDIGSRKVYDNMLSGRTVERNARSIHPKSSRINGFLQGGIGPFVSRLIDRGDTGNRGVGERRSRSLRFRNHPKDSSRNHHVGRDMSNVTISLESFVHLILRFLVQRELPHVSSDVPPSRRCSAHMVRWFGSRFLSKAPRPYRCRRIRDMGHTV